MVAFFTVTRYSTTATHITHHYHSSINPYYSLVVVVKIHASSIQLIKFIWKRFVCVCVCVKERDREGDGEFDYISTKWVRCSDSKSLIQCICLWLWAHAGGAVLISAKVYVAVIPITKTYDILTFGPALTWCMWHTHKHTNTLLLPLLL